MPRRTLFRSCLQLIYLPALLLPLCLAARAESPGSAIPETAAPTAPAPIESRIIFERETYDFGQIRSGEVLKHTYRFRNSGKQPLEIYTAEPGCECTRVLAWDRVVAPGRDGGISIEVNTHGMLGYNSRDLHVTTNSPERPELTLHLVIKAVGLLAPAPDRVFFGLLYPESRPFVRLVRLRNLSQQPVHPGQPAGSLPVFIPSLREIRAGYDYELRVAVAAGLRPGSYHGEIKIQTGSSQAEAVVIPVDAEAPAAVDVRPQKILLPGPVLAAPSERTLAIRYTLPGELKITGVTADRPEVQTRLLPADRGRRFLVQVKFPAGLALPAAGLKIRLTTSEPTAAQVEIPVMADGAAPQR